MKLNDIIFEKQKVSRSWGKEIWWGATEYGCGKLISIYPGNKISLYNNSGHTKSFYLYSGKMILRVGLVEGDSKEFEIVSQIKAGDCWQIKHDTVYQFESLLHCTIFVLSKEP